MVDKLSRALDAGVADLAYFLGVELLPFFVVEFVKEFADELGMNEVDKGVTNIALILNNAKYYPVVDGEVEKVVLLLEVPGVDFLQYHVPSVLVRNIPQH